MKIIYISILCCFLSIIGTNVFGQEQKKLVSEMSKEELLDLTYDDLLALPFEELLQVADKMEMSADELIEFFLNKDVTSASKRSEKSLNSPLSTTVISKEEIISSGATSIPDILRLVPGIIVREKTPGNYDVHIRGNDNVPPKNMFLYSENQMSLIMIDSRPVYNYSFGGTFWETLPIDLGDIERIEVIRGPSSALYGPNAVTGAINIITKKPVEKKLDASLNAQLGNNNAKIANAGLSFGVGKKLKFRLSGNYTHLNRFSDEIYIFDLNQSYSKSVIDTMTTYWLPSRIKMPVNANSTDRIPDASIGTDKYGANGYLFYDLNKQVNVALAFGLQQSNVVSSTLGNGDFPMAGRLSKTNYIDIRSSFYGFQFQANQMWGGQEIQKGSLGWYINPTIRNVNLEYEKTLFGSLTLRPGIGYQQAIYSDQDHLTSAQSDAHMGFLNGSPELNAIAGFLRADYKAFEKLRLIAAVRADKYNVPDDTYLTYQFISSFDINKTNVARVVYSRANRGPFIVDSYANYDWQVVSTEDAAKAPSMYPYTIFWKGNKTLKMPVMDMFEIGYRTQPTKKLMIDIEAFYTTTKNYNYFLPDSFNAEVNFLTKSVITNASGNVRYYNFDLKTIQSGITANVSFALNKQLQLKVFATMQQTRLENLYDKTLWQCFEEMGKPIQDDGKILAIAKMAGSAKTKLLDGDPATNPTADESAALTAYSGSPQMQARVNQIANSGYKQTYHVANKDIIDGHINPDSLINVNHKATPSYFGGASINFVPIPKLHINATLYWYSENTLLQTKLNDIGKYNVDGSKTANYNPNDYSSVYTIDPKFILNLKVSYIVWKDCSVFVNSRNLLNSPKREFGYLDEIKGLYMFGMNLNF
jgi:iron complex outermembrane receptor protein